MSGSRLSGCSPEQREKMIAEAAYLRAKQRGFQGGDPTSDWLEAEREVDRMLAAGAPAEEKPSSVAALVQQLEARIKTLDEDIAPLKARAREVGADVRQEIEKELERLKPLRAAAEQRLAELRGRGGVALEEAKKTADRAWSEISATVKAITNRMKSPSAGKADDDKAQTGKTQTAGAPDQGDKSP